jgi:hypothetical protein
MAALSGWGGLAAIGPAPAPSESLPSRTLQVQRQQSAQDFVIGHRRHVVCPAVGRGHRGVERLVRLRQPGRALVVEVGERALGEILFEAGFSDNTVQIKETRS